MTYLHLLPSCTITEGYRRSLLHDTQSNKALLLSRETAAALKLFSGKQLEEFELHLGALGMNTEAIDDLIKTLQEESFVYLSPVYISFEPVNLKFDQPFSITNAIIDVANTNIDLLPTMLNCFQSIACPHLQLRIFRDVKLDDLLFNSLTAFTNTDTLSTIEILMPFFEDYEALAKHLVTKAQVKIVLYNSPDNHLHQTDGGCDVVLISNILDFPTCCGIIDIEYFNFSLHHYIESVNYNSCLNRKISIDQSGYIKNCPSMKDHFGNVADINFSDVLKNDKFYDISEITKDHIKACSDCEFRNVCTDCRAFLEDPGDIYSKPLKCGYDPYSCTWNNWNNDPKKLNAIKYYNMNQTKR